MSSPEALVRAHLFSHDDAVLATLSTDTATAGFPFGSVVPYALDEQGRPLILVSDIAQHTRNLLADPRASMLVRPVATGDAQATWRVTLVGRMQRVADDAELEAGHARYLARVPGAASYSEAHYFGLWRMEVTRVRFIGGFGNIHWVEADDYLRAPGHSGFGEAARAIIDHMNKDHADALRDYCVGLRDFEPASAELVGVDAAGFFVRTTGPDRLVYFPFESEIAADEARHAFVALLKRARA